MRAAGLAREKLSLESGGSSTKPSGIVPYAAALQQLVSRPDERKKSSKRSGASEARWAALRAELAAQGAPFWGSTRRSTMNAQLEQLLADACELSHHDPSVAKVLPYLFVRNRNELDFDQLERALTENKQKHTAGFFLAVAAALAGDERLNAWAERLRDKRRTKMVDFFVDATSPRLRALADRNTPIWRATGTTGST